MGDTESGCIFLSHAAADKSFVSKIYERLNTSSTFYDIKSVEPGGSFIEAMKEGTAGKNVFVLFHSPNTKGTWVEYEKVLAEKNHASMKGRILVVPLGGESYHTLPEWMKGYMTCTEQFSISDITRQIQLLQNQVIEEISGKHRLVIGREDALRKAHIDTLKGMQRTGKPIQHIVLSGLAGMGRRTFAKMYVAKTFASMRQGGPTFELPDMAESVNFYLTLKQDLDGIFTADGVASQISAFASMSHVEQAQMVLTLATHWAEINQPITFVTSLGLRDRHRDLKPWFKAFIDLSVGVPALRVIYISDRQIPEEVVLTTPNLAQFSIAELDSVDTQYLLSELIDGRLFDAGKAERLSQHIHGHPSTAHFVASFISSGKNLDSINENPEPIFAFQQRVLGEILSDQVLNEDQRKIIALLSIFPRVSFGILARVLELPTKQLAIELWELQEASLISAVSADYYSCPNVVANRARRELQPITETLMEEVRLLIQDDFNLGKVDSQLIDALLIASTTPSGEVPKELFGLLTSSSLMTLVEDRFYQAREMKKGSREVYLSAYNLSKLALGMQASDDAVETILFTGGDSAIRAGIYPEDIIERMFNAALPSVYYLKGSHEFHVKKDDEAAAKYLYRSLEMRHFKLRNVRLLARALIRAQDFSGALSALNRLTDRELEQETGLMIQKIRAHRGLRNHSEADDLERKLRGRDDEFGELHIFIAGKALQERQFPEALRALDLADNRPKANKYTIELIRAAVQIEMGDPTLLPLIVETANSVGRNYDAEQLQARHAVVQGRWQDAERHLNAIVKKDYFDLQIAQRMLAIKMEDPKIKTDAAALRKCRDDMDEIARQSVRSPAGFRTA